MTGPKIEKLDPQLFDWILWRNKNLSDLGVPWRKASLYSHRDRLRAHAVGYCLGENLVCRPKLDHVAVMFFVSGEHFWIHMRDDEFRECFHEP